MFVVAGESLIDLVSDRERTDGLIRMTAHAGGSPYNCAIALAKLGNEAGYLCPISRDGFGDELLRPLSAAGVTQLLETRVAAPSTVAVVTLNEKMQAQYEFYRGADRAFTREGLIAALPNTPALFQIGGFCPILAEDADVWMAVADEATARGAVISMDPNVRPTLVTDPDGYRQRLSDFFDRVHMVKLSDEDLAWLDDTMTIDAHAEALLERPHCELVVVTCGEKGSQAFTRSGQAEAPIYAPPVFGDTVGAGDSLMAGILSYLGAQNALAQGALQALDAVALKKMLQYGAVVAGLNCAEKGCNPPYRAKVESVLATL